MHIGPHLKQKCFQSKMTKNNTSKDWNNDIAKTGNKSLCVVIDKDKNYESQSKCHLRLANLLSWNQNTLMPSPYPSGVFVVWFMTSAISMKKSSKVEEEHYDVSMTHWPIHLLRKINNNLFYSKYQCFF